MSNRSFAVSFKRLLSARWSNWPLAVRHSATLTFLALLLAAGTVVVYVTGGTRYAYPYLMLIPVLLAASVYHLRGGVAVALLAGLLMGPLMPLHVEQGLVQPSGNWLLRLILYVGTGALAGALFAHLTHLAKLRENTLRKSACGLLNDAALATDLERTLGQAQRDGREVALILVQVADYVEILSGVGADSGDQLIGAIGHNLRRAMREHCRVYRFSTSELVVLLDYQQESELDAAVDRILAVGEEPVKVHDVPVRAQLVAGVSRAEGCDRSPQELLRRIRVAAFEALEQQQAFCHYASEYERDTAETIRLVAQVRRALAAGEFELHYQPKIRLADNTVFGCEGLVRWREDEHSLIYPGLFMPKVERTTLISPVTRFVALQAMHFVQQAGTAPVSFNFAVSNLFDERLLDWVVRLVEEQAIPAYALEIEITEGALIRDPEQAKRVIQRLRKAGVCVLLDDFGTGYSSFDNLRQLPISGLKIDRAFVQDLESDSRAYKLMACMIDVAHALDLTVTAEGVETAAQADRLRELGCDLAQGFYFAHPMPEGQYASWLARCEISAAGHREPRSRF